MLRIFYMAFLVNTPEKTEQWKFRPVRREEAVLARVRIGHSYITHSCILKKEDQPQCVACNSPLTVMHIMLDCVDFDLVRTDHFNVDSEHERII